MYHIESGTKKQDIIRSFLTVHNSPYALLSPLSTQYEFVLLGWDIANPNSPTAQLDSTDRYDTLTLSSFFFLEAKVKRNAKNHSQRLERDSKKASGGFVAHSLPLCFAFAWSLSPLPTFRC